MNKKITLTCVWLLCLIWSKGNAQTQFWSDTFEDATAPSAGTRTPSLNTGGGGPPLTYYFMRTDGSNLDLQGVPGGAPEPSTTYVGKQGTWFWAGEDTDRVRTGANVSTDKIQDITWSGINISGKTGLSFKGLFAANNNHEWQDIGLFPTTFDFIEVEYRIDGGSWNLAGGLYSETAPSGGYVYKRLRVDTNQDKIGDGAFLSRVFQEIGWTITGTGTTMELRLRVSADAGATQEFAIDNFRLFETPSCTAPVITANPPNRSICVNGNTTFTSSATGATAYQWQVNTGSGFTDITNGGVYSNAATNVLTLTGATAGMSGYQYRCKAINGVATCFTNSNNATLTLSNITSSTAKNDVLCFGNSSGSAAVSPNGGIGSYTYSWSPSGGTGSIATGLAAGTYTVTITDAISCQITKTITINQPATALTLSTGGGQTNVSCNGGSNGTATVAPTGGTPGYTYSWAPSGGTAATASGLGVGTYTVTVTDANNCQATRSFTITQPTALTLSTGGGQTNVSCNGGTNGTATVAPTGGTPGYTYSWAPSGGTAATASGLGVGVYTVTVTDANNCQATRSFTITQPTALNAITSKTDVACNGGSNGTATVSATGGTPSYTYSWAPSGGTNASATGLTSGTYTCTITDANSCQITRTVTINQPTTALTLSTGGGQTNVSCNGGSNGTATVAPTGGTPGYTYSWAPSGGTAATASGLGVGTYTVTVTDANNCQATRSFTITQPTALTLSTGGGQTNVSCNGGTNGTATVAPTGGTPGYTYSWAPSGGTAATASGLGVGTYTVTVTDANNCQATRSFTITQPTALNAITSKTDVACNGGSNGTATVSATGGTPSYTYSWAPSGGTNASATGLTSGTYTCTITDANSCQITRTVTINQPTTALTLSTGGGQTNVSCNGGTNGTATVAPTGGTPGYTYSWAPSGGTAATASGLGVGTYTVTVTDANNCQATRSFTITQPTALTLSTGGGQTNVSCNGGSNGTATVAPTGGTPGYTYSWAPSGGTAATASGLGVGTYTVTVTDANNCQATRSFTITQPTALTLSTGGGQTNVSCNGGTNGTATVAPTGGTPGYTYSWAPSGGTAATASGLGVGTYTVTVTDANNCQATRSFTITQPTALNAITSKTDVACNGGSNGIATVSATGGTPSYTYSWAPSGGTNASATGLTSGTYTCTITDANSCQITRTVTINQPTTALTLSTGGGQTNVSCNGGSNGTATVAPTGGTPGYTYSWAPSGGTAATASGLGVGVYTVTVTDANNCQATRSFTITQPTALNAITSKTDVSCNGGSNGTASVTATGGTGAYTYSWAPSGGTSATASGLAAGTYTVTVADANTCQATASVTITEPGVLSASATHTNVSCNGGSNGTASVTATGGTGAYTYSWAPSGGTSATASGLAAGTYTVTVADANMCQATASVTITQPTAISATTTLVGETITANQAGAIYQWFDCSGTIITGQTNQSFTATANGSYYVVVSVGLCSATSSCVVVNTLSNPDFEDNSKFVMYPNPSQGIVNIQSGYDVDFQVINQLGQIVRTFKVEANVINTIDLQNLSDSVYFIKQMNNTKSKAQRLIIKK